jgi:hypothetical protein
MVVMEAGILKNRLTAIDIDAHECQLSMSFIGD